jgi:DNA replication licensing factor MCM3
MIGKYNRFNVNIDALRRLKPKLANLIVKHPTEALKIFEDLLNLTVQELLENSDSQRLYPQGSLIQQSSD